MSPTAGGKWKYVILGCLGKRRLSETGNNKLWAGDPTICPAQACKWRHDIRHVRIWIGHHYRMSMLACQYNQQKRPGDHDLWPFDLESGVRVSCDVGYVCGNFGLGLSVLDLGQMHATDRRQTDTRRQTKASLNAPAYLGRGHNKQR